MNIILDHPEILGRDLPFSRGHVPGFIGILAARWRPDQGAGPTFSAGLGHQVASLLQREEVNMNKHVFSKTKTSKYE